MTIAEQITRAKADLDEAYAAGKQAEYDAFWDAYQQNGNRENYNLAFGGSGWTAEMIAKAKYPIRPTRAYRMFEETNISDLSVLPLDFSRCTNFVQAFCSGSIQKIGLVDVRAATDLSYLFNSASYVQTIEKVILREDGSNTFTSTTFAYTTNLTNITFEGVIGKNGFDISASKKLSKASHESIMAAVSTSAAITVTFSKVAVDKAFETAEGANDGSTSPAWLALVDTRPNATIALA